MQPVHCAQTPRTCCRSVNHRLDAENQRLALLGASTSVGRLASLMTFATMNVFPCGPPGTHERFTVVCMRVEREGWHGKMTQDIEARDA